jgi:phosphoribosylanthranilate isomerase
MGLRRTRIKICGITQVDSALAAADAGADAIGLVFYANSSRAVSAAQAAAICAALPPFVSTIGLFVDASADEINAVLDAVPLSALQFHGAEAPDFCARFARPYLKALRMRADLDLFAAAEQFAGASALLLDTYRAGVAGGTGEVFDWQRVPRELAPRIVLAGGLNPDNVAQAVAQVRPYAVDVSGGVESAPGVKDITRIHSFVAAVRRADHLEHSSV